MTNNWHGCKQGTAIHRLLLTCLLCISTNLWAAPEMLIDTNSASLSVLERGKVLLQLDQVAIGRFGASTDKHLGDGKTPMGKYQVGWIKQSSKFKKFIGINYPAPADAQRGLQQKLINQKEFKRIMRAHNQHQVPPQNTRLGGFIGIHGLGQADPEVHKRYNWTRGCVAITNEQLDQLLPWIDKGMLVEIR